MTRNQFASAVRGEEKWVENTARLLGRRLRYTADEARWMGMVRVLSHELGISLSRAAELADEALRYDPAECKALLGRQGDGSAMVAMDLARYHSTLGAAMSAALMHGGARRRGRHRLDYASRARQHGDVTSTRARAVETLTKAAEYGVDIGLLREGLHLSPATRLKQLDENALFTSEMRRSRRDASGTGW